MDLTLLRRLSGAGNWLRAGELVGDEGLEGLDAAEIALRLNNLVASGHVDCYFHTTTAGSALSVRRVHHHRDLRAA